MESLCGVRNIKKEKKTVEVATEYEAALCGAPPIVDPKDLERNFSNELPSGVFQREKERERERERQKTRQTPFQNGPRVTMDDAPNNLHHAAIHTQKKTSSSK